MLNNGNLNIAEVLSRGEIVITGFSGTSMYPLLRSGKDRVVIEKNATKPKCNDVPLYIGNDGKFILHRIVKVKPQGYVIRGDNLYRNEYNVTDKDIIGVLTGFYRNDKFFSCKSLSYKLYVAYIRISYPLRFAWFLKIRPFLVKLKRAVLP